MQQPIMGRSQQVFDLLKKALGPFVLRNYQQHFGSFAASGKALQDILDTPYKPFPTEALTNEQFLLNHVDSRGWLRIIRDGTPAPFKGKISKKSRSYVHLLLEIGNDNAHEHPNDSIEAAFLAWKLLDAIGAKQQADEAKNYYLQWSEGMRLPPHLSAHSVNADPRDLADKPTSVSITPKNKSGNSSRVWLGLAGASVAVIVLMFLFQSGGQFPNTPPQEEILTLDPTIQFEQERNRLAEVAAQFRLSDVQIKELEAILESKGYLTLEDYLKWGLTVAQLQDLRERGYLPYEELVATLDQ
ncbi:MAG: hypothetical protein HZC41_25445 [Chloroflexi bacterium]|nr:hypothetical protein [Chloroflexota bacterium]